MIRFIGRLKMGLRAVLETLTIERDLMQEELEETNRRIECVIDELAARGDWPEDNPVSVHERITIDDVRSICFD